MLWRPSGIQPAPAIDRDRKLQLRAAQVRLLYENVNTGIIVTVLASPVLAYVQASIVSYPIALAWLAYMLLICAARFTLARRYWKCASRDDAGSAEWGALFAVITALAGAGW